MGILFANFASSTLVADISDSALVLGLQPTQGNRFPQPTAGNYFMVVVQDPDGDAEIMRCTGRNGDLLTVVRGQEGTVNTPFPAGSRVENRLTAGVLQGIMYANSPLPTADLVMQGDNLTIRATYHESTAADPVDRAKNRLAIPKSGNRPFIGPALDNEYILTRSDLPIGIIMMWQGPFETIPAKWALCDGKIVNGVQTPDMRGLFPMGAGLPADDPGNSGAYQLPGTKKLKRGTHTVSIDPHKHGGDTGGTAPTTAQLTKHKHNYADIDYAKDADLYAFSSPTTGISGLPATTKFTPLRITSDQSQGVTETGGGDPHKHAIDPDGGFTGGIDIADVSPAYFAVAFIMKVA